MSALQPSGPVDSWGKWVFWTADFSRWQKPGHYRIETSTDAGIVSSCTFAIDDNLLERSTLSNVVYYFKGQRSSGLIDRADSHLPLPDGEPGFVDVHGGWYDATGDYGIHLSHQNPTSYFNPQQVPLVAWSLSEDATSTLEARHDDNFSEYERRLLDEGLVRSGFSGSRLSVPADRFMNPLPGREKTNCRRIAQLAIRTGARRSRRAPLIQPNISERRVGRHAL